MNNEEKTKFSQKALTELKRQRELREAMLWFFRDVNGDLEKHADNISKILSDN